MRRAGQWGRSHVDAQIDLGEHRAIVQLHGNADEKVTDVGAPIHEAILQPRGARRPESQRKLRPDVVALLSSRSPASPGCRRPPVLSPYLDKGRTPRLGLCELPLAAECRRSRLPQCVLVEEDVWGAIDQ